MKEKEISVADYFAELIAGLGIDRVFLVQGGAIMKVVDAVGGIQNSPLLRQTTNKRLP